MSAAELVNACPVCGAEESLDSVLMRMIEDDRVRRLIADVVTLSLPLGGMVVRYLRLHKPPKQRLRMQRVGTLLAELVPDLIRGAITRKGRDWAAPVESWKQALQALFDAAQSGTLTLPLEGNGYLYETLMRQADRQEAHAERTVEADKRSRSQTGARDPGAVDVADALAAVSTPPAVLASVARPAPPAGPSRYALQLQAEIRAAQEARTRTIDPIPTSDERTS